MTSEELQEKLDRSIDDVCRLTLELGKQNNMITRLIADRVNLNKTIDGQRRIIAALERKLGHQ